ncbi:hypothetical protein NJL88_11520 [Streptomyces sp. DK15]|uniref:hypothetical protein n=1 Tax=Streptomyces sp. DK15 TaxID=2957499 RepID=UPI0029B622F3|nr:hypothetical protein [Streptomyces sp. DK15]MDX2390682.1 hypothetical protein [Streptomyces sp. DK15]
MKQAEQVFSLVLAGKSYRAIAEEMGVSLKVVQNRLAKYKAETVGTKAQELREVQHARIQAGIAANWKGYLQGDKDATISMIRLMEREARLMGLDSAQAFMVQSVTVDHESDFDLMLERMRKARAAGQEVQHTVVRGEIA